MRIVPVDETNIASAGWLHSVSWRESRGNLSFGEFISCHTPVAQEAYLRQAIAGGKQVFLLLDEDPVGIVSVDGNLIENLYVLPEAQGRGCGTALLDYAMEQCQGVPTLWVLSGNLAALRLYERRGFVRTGNTVTRAGLCQVELQYRP